MSLTIWTNEIFAPAALQLLEKGTSGHRLLSAPRASASVLNAGASDPGFALVDVAFGQPSLADCFENKRLKWVEVSSAGYTRYDTEEFGAAFRARGAAFTNASGVFADPCAQHVLSMMLAFARQILPSYRDQITDHSWHYDERRYHSRLLTGQTVLLLGFGAIGRRLAELLAPFGVRLLAYRRRALAAAGVEIVGAEALAGALKTADHVVNILPANAATRDFMNQERFAQIKPSAQFYNIGRGTTVDQNALVDALRAGRLAAAYLDVTEPEPLPPEHELWTTPNCFITPHTAGGRHDQDEALVRHFLANLVLFERGEALIDRVF
ncbi:MAG: Phosphoglycerate dehydrogenase [Verrucomicrobia bacterium]|nr:MAG: Phosphoglycerate dehydrogenase [Verrucomicrobiota bacterium]